MKTFLKLLLTLTIMLINIVLKHNQLNAMESISKISPKDTISTQEPGPNILHLAAMNSCPNMVIELLRPDRSITLLTRMLSEINDEENTALVIAVERRDLAIVDSILRATRQCDLIVPAFKMVNKNGKSAFTLAVEAGRKKTSLECYKKLIIMIKSIVLIL